MIAVLVDTSVVLKWLHEEGESEVAEARLILEGHLAGRVEAHLLDLGMYEVGNVLVRGLNWPADEVADQLADLSLVFGELVTPSPEWFSDAAHLAVEHRLTFYDAMWAAAARALGIPLVSADAMLVGAGLAETATRTCQRLALS